jgi:hypothetical protein
MFTLYSPHRAPDPQEWLALDEMERTQLVRHYHKRARIDVPDALLHALIHTVVENQAAGGDETPVAATLDRLMDEGLDRHDAIHAVGNVLAEYLWQMSRGEQLDPDAYMDEIRQLTAQDWLESWRE